MQAHLDLHGPDAWFSDDVRLRPIRSITDFRRVTWYGSDVKAQVQVPLKPADYIDSIKTITDFPVTQQLTPRYADLDADSQRSEAALARYMEQARFGAIRHLDLGGLGILIASMDVSYLHFRAGWEPVGLRAGISRVGNSSFVFTGCATSEHGLQAVANSVMVVIDQASSRPAPMPDALREQLQTLTI